MRVPVWAMPVLLAAILGTLAGAVADRLSIGERIRAAEIERQTLSESLADIKIQLSRIEGKIDRHIYREVR